MVFCFPLQQERPLRRHEVDDFAQRLWAYLTIKNLLDQRKTSTRRQLKDALSERALNLSLKYHFVTPLTSLLVVKPEDEPSVVETEADGEGQLDTEADVLLHHSAMQNKRRKSRPTSQHVPQHPAGKQKMSIYLSFHKMANSRVKL